tara:strand:- start:1040 stop:1366 length:327 start_codon:yes stop_codon:yes gene_type:complete
MFRKIIEWWVESWDNTVDKWIYRWEYTKSCIPYRVLNLFRSAEDAEDHAKELFRYHMKNVSSHIPNKVSGEQLVWGIRGYFGFKVSQYHATKMVKWAKVINPKYVPHG